ncbi:MAG: OmpA family protein, partial [Clostridiales bacterium]
NPSAPEPTDMEELYQALSAYVQQNNQEEFVSISKQDGVIYIRFSSSLFFLPDEYVLRPESIPVLSFIGDGLKSYEDKIRMVNVIGYTATVDNGTYWRLSGERAATVATHFNFNCHFNPQKLTVIGYGNQYPVAPNDTEENRKKNRRVELIIIGNESATDFDVNDALGNYYDPSLYPTDGGVNDIYLPTDTPPPPQTKPLDSNGTSQQEPPPNHVDVGVSPYTE